MGALENGRPLLCELGWHKPKPVVRWNNGYYFTRCARCSEDLVRTAYGRWHVPRGHRVVWQAQPPASAVSAALVPERPASAPTAETELPIQEVLRHLQNDDSAPGSALASQDQAISRPVPSPTIPDFMDEATGVNEWESATRAYLMRPARANRHEVAEIGREEDRGSGLYSRLSARLAAVVKRDRGEPPPELIGDGDAPVRASQNLRLALIGAVPLMLVLIGLLLWTGREGGRVAEPQDNAAQSAAVGPSSGVPAFVTASLLNCRAAPALEADSLKVLMRGDPVLLLARDGEWVSLVHEGGQCWALMRYFAAEQPI